MHTHKEPLFARYFCPLQTPTTSAHEVPESVRVEPTPFHPSPHTHEYAAQATTRPALHRWYPFSLSYRKSLRVHSKPTWIIFNRQQIARLCVRGRNRIAGRVGAEPEHEDRVGGGFPSVPVHSQTRSGSCSCMRSIPKADAEH